MSLSRRRSLAALLVVCLGTLAAPLDSAVNIAFPSITTAFGLPQAGIRWVIIAYVLTYASLTLVFGKLGDLFGYRRVFVTGLVIASAGFAACSLATEFAFLLAGRVLQGVGVALVWSCAPALSTSLYPESERTRVLGFYSAAIAVGSALGPLAGGVLVEKFGWPVVFWARLPLVLVALALAWLVPARSVVSPSAAHATAPAPSPAVAQQPPPPRRTFDWTGAVLLVVWLSAFLLAAARPEMPYAEPATAAMIGLGVLAFWAFIVHENRHPDPIIRPQLFRDPGFFALNLASVAVNLAGFAVMLLVPFHLVRTAGLDPGLGGLVLAANASGVVVGSWLSGRLAARLGPTAITLAGSLISIVGLALVSTWTRDTALAVMVVCLGAQGFGLGLFQVAYADRVLATLPPADRGVAGSLTLVTRTVGIVGAAAGLTALSRHFELAARAEGAADPVLAAFQATFAATSAGLAIGLVLLVIAFRIGAGRRKPIGDGR